jgi:hypothetical protein
MASIADSVPFDNSLAPFPMELDHLAMRAQLFEDQPLHDLPFFNFSSPPPSPTSPSHMNWARSYDPFSENSQSAFSPAASMGSASLLQNSATPVEHPFSPISPPATPPTPTLSPMRLFPPATPPSPGLPSPPRTPPSFSLPIPASSPERASPLQEVHIKQEPKPEPAAIHAITLSACNEDHSPVFKLFKDHGFNVSSTTQLHIAVVKQDPLYIKSEISAFERATGPLFHPPLSRGKKSIAAELDNFCEDAYQYLENIGFPLKCDNVLFDLLLCSYNFC